MEPLELRGFALTLHLLGIVLGGGGALTSAAFFLSSLQKHGTLPARDAAFFRVSALVIWTGIALAIGSGLVLLSLHPGSLLGSPAFQAKLTLVTVVVANGLVITRRHQALLERGTWEQRHREVLASGAVSAVSWLSLLLLGASLRAPGWIDASYSGLMAAYASALAIGTLASLAIGSRSLRPPGRTDVALASEPESREEVR